MSEDFNIFHGQFFVTDVSLNSKLSWKKHKIGKYYVYAHENLHVIRILDTERKIIGCFIGLLIQVEGDPRIVTEDITLNYSKNKLSHTVIEDFVYSFGGRFIAIVVFNDMHRIYLDAMGSLGLVYSTEHTVAASTTSLLNLVKKLAFDKRADSSKPPKLSVNQYYPAGETSDKNIKRCIPNHYLDLKTFQSRRHYPNSSLERVNDDRIPQKISTIADYIEASIMALVNDGHVYCTLTAGKESRSILACTRTAKDKIKYFTFNYGDLKSKHDIVISRKLAKICQLDHAVFKVGQLNPAQYDDYLYRIGYDGFHGKSTDFYNVCINNMDMRSSLIVGFGGPDELQYFGNEIFYEHNRLTINKFLLERITVPDTVNVTDALHDWYTEIDYFDIYTIFDLLYLENRFGCWASAHMYGFAPFKYVLVPFNHRKIVDITLKLPVKFRFGDKAITKNICRYKWDIASSVPYHVNFYGKLESLLRRIKRLRSIN